MNTKKFVVFDLDGTLIDTLSGITLALNRTLLECGYKKCDYTKEEVKHFIGGGARRLFRLGTQKDEIDEKEYSLYCKYYEYYQPVSECFPNVINVLHALKSKGYELFIFSNKPHELLLKLCELKFEKGLFTYIQGQEECYPPKPDVTALNKVLHMFNLDPKDGYYVGDSKFDVLTSRNANLKSVIYKGGYGFIDDILVTKPDYLFSDYNELKEIIKWHVAKNMFMD